MPKAEQKKALQALVCAQGGGGSKEPLIAKFQELAAGEFFQALQLALSTPRQKLPFQQPFALGDGNAREMANPLVSDRGRDGPPDGGRAHDSTNGAIFDFEFEIAGPSLGLLPTTGMST